MQATIKTGRSCAECGCDTVYSTTALSFSRDGIVVKVQGVAAEVCPQCGETYIEGEVAEALGKAVRKAVRLITAARARKDRS